MKDDRRQGAIIDCNVLADLIGTLKVILSLDMDEYVKFRNISAVRLEIWCPVGFGFFS